MGSSQMHRSARAVPLQCTRSATAFPRTGGDLRLANVSSGHLNRWQKGLGASAPPRRKTKTGLRKPPPPPMRLLRSLQGHRLHHRSAAMLGIGRKSTLEIIERGRPAVPLPPLSDSVAPLLPLTPFVASVTPPCLCPHPTPLCWGVGFQVQKEPALKSSQGVKEQFLREMRDYVRGQMS